MKTSPGNHKAEIRIAIILIIALLLRLGLWAYIYTQDTNRFIARDTSSYIRTAQALLYAGAFSVSMELPDKPETIRTPGYPLYLAACFAALGEHPPRVILTQILLNLGTIAIVYWIVKSTWGLNTATIAALLLALDIPSLTYTLQLLSETLFTFMVTVMIAAGICMTKNPQGRLSYLLAGISLSLATMVRPISYYLVFPLGVGLIVWAVLSKLAWRAILLRAILFFLPFLLIVGGWQVRNYLLTGDSAVSQIQAYNLLAYRAADIIALRDGLSIEEAQAMLGINDNSGIRTSRQEVIRNDHYMERGLEIIRAYPGLFLRSWFNGLLNLILGSGEGAFMQMVNGKPVPTSPIDDLKILSISEYLLKWMVNNLLYFLVFLYALAFLSAIYLGVLVWLGIALSHKQFSPVDVFCWGVFLYFVVLTAGPEGYYRFRVPLMPILSIYSAQGWIFLSAWFKWVIKKYQGNRQARRHAGYGDIE